MSAVNVCPHKRSATPSGSSSPTPPPLVCSSGSPSSELVSALYRVARARHRRRQLPNLNESASSESDAGADRVGVRASAL
eukprot:1234897-Prymnesium_polylepis.1